jgi:hypothetical protein
MSQAEAGNPKSNKYQTPDLNLSAFLRARGHQLLDVRREGGRGIFVFQDSDELRRDLMNWGNNVPVPLAARAFVNGMRDLKGMVGA